MYFLCNPASGKWHQIYRDWRKKTLIYLTIRKFGFNSCTHRCFFMIHRNRLGILKLWFNVLRVLNNCSYESSFCRLEERKQKK